MEIRVHYVLFLAVVLSAVALWYFGRTCPIETHTKSKAVERKVACKDCDGTGKQNCPQCGGFGSVESWITCPYCKGTGKANPGFSNKLNAPCQNCRGSGRIRAAAQRATARRSDSREKCTHCNGFGNVQCPTCNGTGKTRSQSTSTSKTITMGHSLREKCLLFLHLSVDPNPCPQKNSNGAYPIVTEYVKASSTKRPARVIDWGECKKVGSTWSIDATVEFTLRKTSTTNKTITFLVQNRELIGTKKSE